MPKSASGVTGRRLREAVELIFLTSFGVETITSVTGSATNQAGNEYIELRAGHVLAWNRGLDAWLPNALSAVAAASTSSKELQVDDSTIFHVGDYLFVNNVINQIEAIDDATNTLTLVTAITAAIDEEVRVDGYRMHSKTTAAVTTSATVPVSDAGRFKAGDTVTVGSATGQTVNSVDTGAGTITLAANVTQPAGSFVFTENAAGDAHYRLQDETMRFTDLDRGQNYPNTLVSVRRVGEVRKRLVIGLTSAAQTALAASGIEFSLTDY